MLKSKFGQTLLGVIAAALVAMTYVGCQGTGNTNGEPETAEVSGQLVADGGFGSTLTIAVSSPLGVGDRAPFTVTAVDPNGLPLAFIRIACESESGIAILEPSRGGTAFESTGAAGVMSGVVGGVAPGSYVLECRGPEGFNLVDRISILITGDVPEGFDGFPGAAGGNLGGGLIVEEPAEDATVVEILFVDPAGTESRNGQIDTVFDPDCNNDGILTDPEPNFGFDNYVITIDNDRDDRLFVESITFSIPSLGVVSSTQMGGLVVQPNSANVGLVGSFTDFIGGTKSFAGTGIAVPADATVNVTFSVSGTTGSGSSFTLTQSAVVTFGNVNNC